ncbi:Slam-dependent surface lipoprotein [Pseudomonas parafulva]|uniref:Slam-dependent surface lipoprotein n=1 Tax=Pseudomonas parafulva TaxID=157782 RepID=UPI00048D8B4C|nr:Slam-dependent surface lipoprotein [Pseudomonas parafulva]
MVTKLSTPLAVLLLAQTFHVQADVASKQSYCCQIVVGGSEAQYANELEGAGVPAVSIRGHEGGAIIPFENLKSVTPVDANGVTRLSWSGLPPADGTAGRFNFKQVSNQHVYFGEWSQSGLNNAPERIVYYAGDNSGRVLPTTPVTYAVQGISNYAGSNIMSGELTATFGTAVSGVVGSLANAQLKVEIDAIINGVWFDGGATAIDPNTNAQLSKGWSKGSFFGAGETASLAGVAHFGNRDFDIAFGGVKK